MSDYIDVTNTFLVWHGSPTGIQRVIQGVSRVAKDREFKLVAFHPSEKRWYHIPNSVMLQTFESDLFVRSNRRLKSILFTSKERANSFRNLILKPVKAIVRPTYHRYVHRLGVRLAQRGRESLLKNKGSPVRFAANDRVFILDVCWDLPFFLPSLAAEKKRQPGLKIVGFIYDVIPMTHPQFNLDPRFTERFTAWIHQLLEVSSYILTDSKDAANAVVQVYKGRPGPRGTFRLSLPSGKTLAHLEPPRAVRFGSRLEHATRFTHQPPTPQDIFGEIESCELTLSEEQRHALMESGGWALWVGTMMPRKNLEVQINAFDPLWKAESIHLPLIWVGRIGGGVEKLFERIRQAPHLRSNVIHLESVPDSLLWSLFQGARFSLYTSWTEGFGLPVSESLQYGCPVIASSGGSIPEVAGPLVDYFDPGDAEGLRKHILRYQDADELAKAREKARRFNPFSWEDTLADFKNLGYGATQS